MSLIDRSRIMSCAAISLVITLQTVFVLLRQCGIIDWNWILVMLPAIAAISSYIILNALCFILWLRGYGKDN